MGFEPTSNEFLDIQATKECRFTLKRVRDMVITYSHNFNSFILHVKSYLNPLENTTVNFNI